MPSIPYAPSRQALYHLELKPTLFSQSAVLFLTDIAVAIARLAYVRTEESNDSCERLNKALALVDFNSVTLFICIESGGAAFGFLHSSGLAILAFRGNQADHLQDMLTAGNIILNTWALGAGMTHARFARSVLSLWPIIEQWLHDTVAQRTTLLVCGHSLGAVATLLILPCGAAIGSLRISDSEFCSSLLGISRLIPHSDLTAAT